MIELDRSDVSSLITELLNNPLKFHSFEEGEFKNIIKFMQGVYKDNPDEVVGFMNVVLREYEEEGGNGCAIVIDAEGKQENGKLTEKVVLKIYMTKNQMLLLDGLRPAFEEVANTWCEGIDEEKDKDVDYVYVFRDGSRMKTEEYSKLSDSDKKYYLDNKFWKAEEYLKNRDKVNRKQDNE